MLRSVIKFDLIYRSVNNPVLTFRLITLYRICPSTSLQTTAFSESQMTQVIVFIVVVECIRFPSISGGPNDPSIFEAHHFDPIPGKNPKEEK